MTFFAPQQYLCPRLAHLSQLLENHLIVADNNCSDLSAVFVGEVRQGFKADRRGVIGTVGLLWQGVVAR